MSTAVNNLEHLIAQIERNVPGAIRLEFTAGQAVYECSDSAQTFYLIESGEIWVYHGTDDGHSRLLDILGPGAWIGTGSLADLPIQDKHAVAAGPAVVWAIPIAELRKYLAQHGEMAVEILGSVARRLHEAWVQGDELVSQDCRLRLIKTLLRFSTSPAAERVKDGVILRITHAQLARAVGAARETVSICLTELRHRHIIRTGRNQLAFDPDQLLAYSNDWNIELKNTAEKVQIG